MGICGGQKRRVEGLSDTGRYLSRNTAVVKSQFRPQLKIRDGEEQEKR